LLQAGSQTWTAGPSFNIPRKALSCKSIKWNPYKTEKTIIAVGGGTYIFVVL